MFPCGESCSRRELPIQFTDIINPCRHFSKIGTSVSRWCSHGIDDRRRMPRPIPRECSCRCFGQLVQSSELCIAANVPVPFSGRSIFQGNCFLLNGINCDCDCFDDELEEGVVLLDGPRIYRVEYTINVPAGMAVSTEVHLMAGDEIVPGSSRIINQPANGTGTTVHVDTILDVFCGVMPLSLVTTNGICITSALPDEPVATLTITSIN